MLKVVLDFKLRKTILITAWRIQFLMIDLQVIYRVVTQQNNIKINQTCYKMLTQNCKTWWYYYFAIFAEYLKILKHRFVDQIIFKVDMPSKLKNREGTSYM